MMSLHMLYFDVIVYVFPSLVMMSLHCVVFRCYRLRLSHLSNDVITYVLYFDVIGYVFPTLVMMLLRMCCIWMLSVTCFPLW